MAVSAGVGYSVKSCACVFLVGMNLRHFRFLGIPYYFVGVAIYRAHRAVTFAIAWLSCFYSGIINNTAEISMVGLNIESINQFST